MAMLDIIKQKKTAAIGGWISELFEPALAAYMDAGFDYVGIDCQHSLIDEAAAGAVIRRAAHLRKPVIARVSANKVALIGRLADSGADAIIVPGVETAAEAASAVGAVLYPPHGIRSFGPIRDDLGFDPRKVEKQVDLLVMIETRKGLENAQEICATPGIAGIYVGPADLSIGLSLPVEGAFDTDQLDDAFLLLHSECRKNGIMLGAHVLNAASAARRIANGCDLISLSSNVALFRSAANEAYRALTSASGVGERTGIY